MSRKLRAREAGLSLPGTPGPHNAITDVRGVEVGYATVLLGQPADYTGPKSLFARTGVTAVLPKGKRRSAVFAGRHDLNGNGELTGTHWIDDSGFLHGPVMITNTYSVGIVRDATARWMFESGCYYPIVVDGREIQWHTCFYPVVGETYDGALNNACGFHVTAEHTFEALNTAKGGAVAEGNIGGGTGMRCHGFKGGTGTASRVLSVEDGEHTVGVLVQANHGLREDLVIGGVSMAGIEGSYQINNTLAPPEGTGSIIVVIATDAPLLPHQLNKLCRRATIGIGKLGGGYGNGSGDIFIAFSTDNDTAFGQRYAALTMMHDDLLDPIFKAVAEATEEAILNALFAAETMVGKDFNTSFALPVDQVLDIIHKRSKP